MKQGPRARVALAAGLAAAILAACQLVVGIDDVEGLPRPPDAASPDDASPMDAGDPCIKRQPPGPPDPSLAAAPGAQSLVFAFRRLTTKTPSGEPIGYDLDGRCTGIDASTTSAPPCEAPVRTVADFAGGVDNALLTVLNRGAVETDAGDPLGKVANQGIEQGIYTNLIGVFDYNGTPDDSEVKVGVVLSTGLTSVGCAPDAGPKTGPRWDGCDTWLSAPGSITANIWPTVTGYVSGDVLVVKNAEEAKLGLLLNEVIVSGTVLTARMVRDGSGKIVGLTEGVLAGRAEPSSLLRSVQFVDVEDELICKQAALLEIIKSTLCGSRDLPLRAADDGRGGACSALSFGFGFEAGRARVGGEGPFPSRECPEDAGVACP